MDVLYEAPCIIIYISPMKKLLAIIFSASVVMLPAIAGAAVTLNGTTQKSLCDFVITTYSPINQNTELTLWKGAGGDATAVGAIGHLATQSTPIGFCDLTNPSINQRQPNGTDYYLTQENGTNSNVCRFAFSSDLSTCLNSGSMILAGGIPPQLTIFTRAVMGLSRGMATTALASVSDTLADPGTLLIVGAVIALPLLFWLIAHIVSLFPGKLVGKGYDSFGFGYQIYRRGKKRYRSYIDDTKT